MASDSIPEEWRPVEGWPYEVSNLGRVRRSPACPRAHGVRPGFVLKSSRRKADGRMSVNLRRNNTECVLHLVHRLVAFAFLGPPPSTIHQVAHWNGNPEDNRLENLRWATPVENAEEALGHGTRRRGEQKENSKLRREDVLAICRDFASGGVSRSELAAQYGVAYGTISSIIAGRYWRWLPRETTAPPAAASPPPPTSPSP